MVDFNNSYLLGQEYINTYVRNIEKLRKTIENSLLYVVSYFVEHSESIDEKIMSVGILVDNKSYLQELGQKYFKRNFDFQANNIETLKVYGVLSNLIHHSKKLCQYDYCELVDFMKNKPEYFKDITWPDNVISNINSNIKEYHKTPLLLIQKDSVKPCRISTDLKPTNIDTIIHNKFLSPVHLYADTLSNIKKAIDFESLKFYDYLCEQDIPRIHSNKLLSIIDDLKDLCEHEYTKNILSISVSPVNSASQLTHKEIFIDELASNIHRGMDTKNLLALDLQKFLKHSEGKELSEGIKKGFYPELRTLIYN